MADKKEKKERKRWNFLWWDYSNFKSGLAVNKRNSFDSFGWAMHHHFCTCIPKPYVQAAILKLLHPYKWLLQHSVVHGSCSSINKPHMAIIINKDKLHELPVA